MININLVSRKRHGGGSMSAYMKMLKSRITEANMIKLIQPLSSVPKIRRLAEYIYFPFYVKKNIKKPGVVHICEQYLAFILNFVNIKNTVVTYHGGLSLKRLKNYNLRDRLTTDFFIKGLRKADHIIAVSHTAKNDLITFLKCDPLKIEVIYYGVDPVYKVLDNVEKNKNKKCILHVGCDDKENRKNIVGILKSLANLKKRFPDFEFIQVGDHNRNFDDLIQKLGLKNEVKFLGFISDSEKLARLYNKADLFVFPSFYEGFGWPPLEAMACGCPTITSNNSSLPEVVGNAAILINPHNLGELEEAMYSVLTSEENQKVLSKKGLERAAKFNWEESAQKTKDSYKRVLEKRGS